MILNKYELFILTKMLDKIPLSSIEKIKIEMNASSKTKIYKIKNMIDNNLFNINSMLLHLINKIKNEKNNKEILINETNQLANLIRNEILKLQSTIIILFNKLNTQSGGSPDSGVPNPLITTPTNIVVCPTIDTDLVDLKLSYDNIIQYIPWGNLDMQQLMIFIKLLNTLKEKCTYRQTLYNNDKNSNKYDYYIIGLYKFYYIYNIAILLYNQLNQNSGHTLVDIQPIDIQTKIIDICNFTNHIDGHAYLNIKLAYVTNITNFEQYIQQFQTSYIMNTDTRTIDKNVQKIFYDINYTLEPADPDYVFKPRRDYIIEIDAIITNIKLLIKDAQTELKTIESKIIDIEKICIKIKSIIDLNLNNPKISVASTTEISRIDNNVVLIKTNILQRVGDAETAFSALKTALDTANDARQNIINTKDNIKIKTVYDTAVQIVRTIDVPTQLAIVNDESVSITNILTDIQQMLADLNAMHDIILVPPPTVVSNLTFNNILNPINNSINQINIKINNIIPNNNLNYANTNVDGITTLSHEFVDIIIDYKNIVITNLLPILKENNMTNYIEESDNIISNINSINEKIQILNIKKEELLKSINNINKIKLKLKFN